MHKYGFLGGTFDPIHNGHLHLALEILEKHQLDRVFFCPAQRSPEKGEMEPVAPSADRLAMAALAIEPIEAFSLIDSEILRQGPSYTVDTIRQLKKEHPKAHFHLILGEDLLQGLGHWKEVEALLQLAPPLIGTRHQKLPSKISLPDSLLEGVRAGLTRIPLLDISSTDLRKRLKMKKYCGHLLPAKVLDYIKQNQLY